MLIKTCSPTYTIIKTPPTSSVDVKALIKLMLRRSSGVSGFDTLFQTYTDVAVDKIEGMTGLVMRQTVFEAYSENLTCAIELKHTNPLTGSYTTVSSITYEDENGDTQTLSTDYYQVVNRNYFTYIVFFGDDCEHTQDTTRCCDFNSVKITYTCGFTTIPSNLQAAIAMLAAYYFENGLCSEGGGAIPDSVYQAILKYIPLQIRGAGYGSLCL